MADGNTKKPIKLADWEKLETVWACYDGKLGRCTKLKVLEVSKRRIKVAGVLWADSAESDTVYTFPRDYRQGYQVCTYAGYQKYDDSGGTLMELLGIGPGDYYAVIPIDPDSFRSKSRYDGQT